MTWWVGTSGWQYRDWKPSFYPRDLPQRLWLEHYSQEFETVELNNSFYRLPDRDTFASWADRTPPAFCVAVKASRYLTHVRRLSNPSAPVDRLLTNASGLGAKLGPILVQLPPNLRADPGRLQDTLDAFAARVRVVVEVRHNSWLVDDVFDTLARHNAALCLTDRRGRKSPVVRTADWAYLRLHEGTATPRPCYGERALRSWVDRLKEEWPPDADRYVYFNNDPGACAVRNAIRFRALTGATAR
jgi:uncharacterized protein YecE (DUF72 family)